MLLLSCRSMGAANGKQLLTQQTQISGCIPCNNADHNSLLTLLLFVDFLYQSNLIDPPDQSNFIDPAPFVHYCNAMVFTMEAAEQEQQILFKIAIKIVQRIRER